MDCIAAKRIIEREYPGTLKIIVDYRSNALIFSADELTLYKIHVLAEYLDDKRWYHLPAKDLETVTKPIPAK